MSETIYLRVGTEDRTPFRDFIDSLRNFQQVLQDLDATISQHTGGSLVWDVVALEKNSPPVIGVAPRLKNRRLRDFSAVIEEQLLVNTRLLSESADRNKYLSDAALANIERLAKRTPVLGPMAIYLEGEKESVKDIADINTNTLSHVQQLTSVKYTALGTIIGSLDSINVHNGNEFRVWDEDTNKAVRCRFNEKDLDRVKSLLKGRVIVYGELQSNSLGNPIAITADDFQPAPSEVLPTIDEMSGLIENFTGSLSLKEYMEMLSNE